MFREGGLLERSVLAMDLVDPFPATLPLADLSPDLAASFLFLA